MLEKDRFREVAIQPDSEKWDHCITRYQNLYERTDDIRSEFLRDYNRILHCKAYRRLKHKTQVFFATKNDHICTRMEHVSHVASVSETISGYLGLNTDLTRAIALGHDLGHAPFGHKGELILKKLSQTHLNETFWHEQNSLWFVDKLETLPDAQGRKNKLSLTYGVRDGIISHCGEVNENAIKPRNEFIDLYHIKKPNQFAPYTWEGCIVKISDKISYLGRDIEDALTLKILGRNQLRELKVIVEKVGHDSIREINNTVLMHDFISNLIAESSPSEGIRFSDNYLELINSVKSFNYKHIYNHPRLIFFHEYAELILSSLFNLLADLYTKEATIDEVIKLKESYPILGESFYEWLENFAPIDFGQHRLYKHETQPVYNISIYPEYLKSIIHYLSSMTDNFAINIFNEITKF
ncbi:MAG: HD domain-containing protein [Salinivirgaceae bacterium]|jgi:dGTPase|nr:HD domain-containing protein [Salinivirgaceae bacterium]